MISGDEVGIGYDAFARENDSRPNRDALEPASPPSTIGSEQAHIEGSTPTPYLLCRGPGPGYRSPSDVL